MSENAYCPYCGSIMKKGDAFCNNCGASLDSSSQPSQTQPTPQPMTSTQPMQPTQPIYYGAEPIQTQPVAPPMNKAADQALVWGIVGLFCFFAAIPAIIFGIQGMKNPYNKNKAIIGLVLGIIVLGIAVFGIIRLFLW